MNSVEILRPDLDSIPKTLKSQDTWVLWKISKDGRKIPFCAETLEPLDITEFLAGSTFEKTSAQYQKFDSFSGVGLILSDRLIGIDLDDCVHDGVISRTANEIINMLRCEYVEYSPSGKGLHAFGYSWFPVENTTGFYKRQRVEIYCCNRYLTITGRRLKSIEQSGRPDFFNNLAMFIGCLDVRLPTQETQVTKETKEFQLTKYTQARDQLPQQTLDNLPEAAVPTGHGQRNRCLFELARYLRKCYPNASCDELEPLVRLWFLTYRTRILTQDYGVTLAEFRYCVDKIKYPDGAALEAALSQQLELPRWMANQRYGKKGEEILRICCALAKFHAPKPFFLSARKAGELMNLHFTDCSSLLRALVLDGYLECLDKGNRRKAATYRLCEPEKTAEEQEVYYDHDDWPVETRD